MKIICYGDSNTYGYDPHGGMVLRYGAAGRWVDLVGSTLRSRTPAFKAQLLQTLTETLWPLLETKQLKPVIHAVLPMEQAEQAHSILARGGHIGKVVLELS